MDLKWDKVICMLLMFTITFVLGLLPCIFHKRLELQIERQSERSKQFTAFIGYLSCFVGGALLSLTFLDLLPGSQKIILASATPDSIMSSFPLAEMLCALTMLLLLLFDKTVHRFQKSDCCHKNQETNELQETSLNNPAPQSSIPYGALETDRNTANIELSDVTQSPETSRQISTPGVDHGHFDFSNTRSPRFLIVFIFALSFHGLFEGMALGFQKTRTELWTLFLGVVLHQAVLSLMLGLELVLVRNANQYQRIFGLVVFAGFPLTGIAIGIVLQHVAMEDPSSSTVIGVLQSFASGSILYIAFFEILFRELSHKGDLFKVLSILCGFGVLTVIIGFSNH